nr:Sua5/YciO/YrdC/YwlC family protein [Pseudofulvimonas gallinarii]
MAGAAIDTAVAALRSGGIVLHPTEAVWGLACDPMDGAALDAVYALKRGRPERA